MRQMEIPSFREITISDLENLYKHRLSQTVVLWPNQAIPFLGYMCWPNDPAERDELMLALRNWSNGSQLAPPGLGRIQHEWLRIADTLHDHYDLHHGGYPSGQSLEALGEIQRCCARGNGRDRSEEAAGGVPSHTIELSRL